MPAMRHLLVVVVCWERGRHRSFRRHPHVGIAHLAESVAAECGRPRAGLPQSLRGEADLQLGLVPQLVQPGYVVHHITPIMLSVRLCGEGASGLVFFLLGVI
jgi:hypothetical protein